MPWRLAKEQSLPGALIEVEGKEMSITESQLKIAVKEVLLETSQSQIDDILLVSEMLIAIRADVAKLRKTNDPNIVEQIDARVKKSLDVLERML